MFDYLGTAPEAAGVAVLAPNSRDNTWDAIGGSFGPDVKFLIIDRARDVHRLILKINVSPFQSK